jgi:hypothetical protein
MPTNVPGDAARRFAWQMLHYIQRGGPNDPSQPSTGGPPVTTGGICGFNSTVVLGPVPGGPSAAPRTMSVNGTTSATTGSTITTNNGGVLLGTLPQGGWIHSIELFIYTAFSGGTNDTLALYTVPAGSAYPAATANILATATTLTAGLQGLPSPGVALATAPGLGPGSGAVGTLAASDLDVYFLTYKAGGTGTAFTAGQCSWTIYFTGDEG